MYRTTLRRALRKGLSAVSKQTATVTQVNPQKTSKTNKKQSKTPFSFEQNLYKNNLNSFNQ